MSGSRFPTDPKNISYVRVGESESHFSFVQRPYPFAIFLSANPQFFIASSAFFCLINKDKIESELFSEFLTRFSVKSRFFQILFARISRTSVFVEKWLENRYSWLWLFYGKIQKEIFSRPTDRPSFPRYNNGNQTIFYKRPK